MPIIVSALLGKADAAMLDALRRAHFPPERNHLAAHLTMFHHLPPSVAGELATRLRSETAGVAAPAARLAGLLNLGGGTAIRVRSEGLAAIRARLADAFSDCLVPQDSSGWRPHVTVQNKVTSADARALQAQLAGPFDDRPLSIAGLAAWWYRGGPWELVGAWRFGA